MIFEVVLYLELLAASILLAGVRGGGLPERRSGERGIHFIGRLVVYGHLAWGRAVVAGLAYLVRPKQPDNGGDS